MIAGLFDKKKDRAKQTAALVPLVKAQAEAEVRRSRQEMVAAAERWSRLQPVFLVGAALVVVGAVLWATAPKKPKQNPRRREPRRR